MNVLTSEKLISDLGNYVRSRLGLNFPREKWGELEKKIALAAAKQSQRNAVPRLEEVKDIKEVLAQSTEYDLKLIPALIGERKPLKEIFAKQEPKKILALIGPEGDFTSEEVALAVQHGCIPISLGDLVLRVDTAAIAVAAYLAMGATRL